MTNQEILSHVDHTLLTQTAVWDDVKMICDDAVRYGTASVCIPPCYVKRAKEYVGESMRVCTVIGFPNGYHTTAVKCFEAEDALKNGADELDMVINLGMLRSGDISGVTEEIRKIKELCRAYSTKSRDGGEKILKVIIETCLLTEEEKIAMCHAVTEAGADYIKTSTGFSKGGATFADVKLMKEHVGPGVKIKAAGGISSLADAEEFLRLGADRLGTSRIVKLVKEEEK